MFTVPAATLSDGHTVKKNFKADQICRKDRTMQIRNMIGTMSSRKTPQISSSATSFATSGNILVASVLFSFPFFDSCRPVDDEDVIAEYPSFVHPNIWYVLGAALVTCTP